MSSMKTKQRETRAYIYHLLIGWQHFVIFQRAQHRRNRLQIRCTKTITHNGKRRHVLARIGTNEEKEKNEQLETTSDGNATCSREDAAAPAPAPDRRDATRSRSRPRLHDHAAISTIDRYKVRTMKR